MSNEKTIEHSGVVLRQEGRKLIVQIVSSAACASCKAAQLCNSSESKTKTVEVWAEEGEVHSVGDEVMIVGETRLGLMAACIAYVGPLVCMVGGLVCAKVFGASDALAGLVGLAAMLPYFAVVFALRGKLNKAFTFKTKNQIM